MESSSPHRSCPSFCQTGGDVCSPLHFFLPRLHTESRAERNVVLCLHRPLHSPDLFCRTSEIHSIPSMSRRVSPHHERFPSIDFCFSPSGHPTPSSSQKLAKPAVLDIALPSSQTHSNSFYQEHPHAFLSHAQSLIWALPF